VALVVRYHEGEETDQAFDALRVGAESLAEAEVGLMYDAQTADRLVQTLRRCIGGPRPGGAR
jgi:hypothetical protein